MNGIVTCRWGFRWTVHSNLQPRTSVFTLQLLWVSNESKMVLGKSGFDGGLNFESVCVLLSCDLSTSEVFTCDLTERSFSQSYCMRLRCGPCLLLM